MTEPNPTRRPRLAWLHYLPCTSRELAVQLGVTPKHAGSLLNYARVKGLVRRSGMMVPHDGTGYCGAIWERTNDIRETKR